MYKHGILFCFADPGGYIGAAFGGFIFGVLLVTLGVFIMYRRHQKQM